MPSSIPRNNPGSTLDVSAPAGRYDKRDVNATAVRRDVPDANAAAVRHDEWLLDAGIAESFPASDPTSSSQPGSLVNVRYATRERTAELQEGDWTTFWWSMAGCLVFYAAFVAGRGPRRR